MEQLWCDVNGSNPTLSMFPPKGMVVLIWGSSILLVFGISRVCRVQETPMNFRGVKHGKTRNAVEILPIFVP